jgi:AAA domain-containing protein
MCPLVPSDQLAGPQFGSIAIVGAPKTGKTQSLATLHAFLVRHKLCPRMAIFDLDEDGAEPLIRIANKEGWINDLEVYRYNVRGSRIANKELPDRVRAPTESFINEFSSLYDRIDSRTGGWSEGKALGAVIIDSMTALNERWFDFVLAIRRKEVGGEGNQAITFNEWTMVKSKLLETVRSAKALPCYSVFIFHEILLQEEVSGPKPGDTKTTGNMLWVPKVTGDLTTTIQKEFSAVVHSRGGDWKWITRPTDRIRSVGSRSKAEMPAEVGQDFENILSV